MADLSDVETALVGALVPIVYPFGLEAPSLTGCAIRVYRGWPTTTALETDLASGIVNISVFSVLSATRNTTRWGLEAHVRPSASSLTVTVDGIAATFAGVAAAGQLAGLLVDGVPYVHQVVACDTPAVIASRLAAAVRTARPCWLDGATLSVPGITRLVARCTAAAEVITEWQRQRQGFRISIWAPTPPLRDRVCGAVGAGLSTISFLTFADGAAGRIRFQSSETIDDGQDAGLYRRDFIYEVEYPTTVLSRLPSMLFADLGFRGDSFYS